LVKETPALEICSFITRQKTARPAIAAFPKSLSDACPLPGVSNRVLFDHPYLPKGIPQLWIKDLRSNRGSVDLFLERRNDAGRLRLRSNKVRSK
jgi:hypothetical protein